MIYNFKVYCEDCVAWKEIADDVSPPAAPVCPTNPAHTLDMDSLSQIGSLYCPRVHPVATVSGDGFLSAADKIAYDSSASITGARGTALYIRNNASNPTFRVDCIADALIFGGLRFASVSLTADVTAAGANGLDTGAEAANTWYSVWAIAKPDLTLSALLSVSSTAPTMPAGYTQKMRVGWVRNNSSSNFYNILQSPGDPLVRWNENTAASPFLFLSAGTATGWTASSAAAIAPPTCRSILAELTAQAGVGVAGFAVRPTGGTAALIYSPRGVLIATAERNVGLSAAQSLDYANIDNAGYNGDGIAATTAQVNTPFGVFVDAAGNIFIADYFNHRIRRVDAGTGLISTVAGTGTGGYNGDGIAATTARVYNPTGVHVDSTGNIFIADRYNHRIRRVDAGTGLISTVAGTGTAGYNGDGIAATTARVCYPYGVHVDSTGNIFIADYYNHRIRRVDAGTGLISTVAGTAIYATATICAVGYYDYVS